ncbi:hypothetical protein [Lysobacter gummosus]|uniref:hypothetical protein n=1 Tax=Lysobacter gummosus TaxID=262324 RepID=UPI00362CF9E4
MDACSPAAKPGPCVTPVMAARPGRTRLRDYRMALSRKSYAAATGRPCWHCRPARVFRSIAARSMAPPGSDWRIFPPNSLPGPAYPVSCRNCLYVRTT